MNDLSQRLRDYHRALKQDGLVSITLPQGFSNDIEEAANRIDGLEKTLAEVQKVNSMNDRLVDDLNETIQDTLNPVVKATLLLEKSENLSEEQKRKLANANYGCRNLIDTMNYRAELTQLSSGNDKLTEG